MIHGLREFTLCMSQGILATMMLRLNLWLLVTKTMRQHLQARDPRLRIQRRKTTIVKSLWGLRQWALNEVSMRIQIIRRVAVQGQKMESCMPKRLQHRQHLRAGRKIQVETVKRMVEPPPMRRYTASHHHGQIHLSLNKVHLFYQLRFQNNFLMFDWVGFLNYFFFWFTSSIAFNYWTFICSIDYTSPQLWLLGQNFQTGALGGLLNKRLTIAAHEVLQ